MNEAIVTSMDPNAGIPNSHGDDDDGKEMVVMNLNTNENVKLHEMGEALEIAEDRCNTLKEQLDQMRNLYRERSSSVECTTTAAAAAAATANVEVKQPMQRQNSDAITTDNSGAAVLTINNILNGITNSINRLSELHSYMEPEPRTGSVRRKKSRHATRNDGGGGGGGGNSGVASIDRRSSSWILGDKRRDAAQKKRSKRSKPSGDTHSLTQIKKAAPQRPKIPPVAAAREEASCTSVKNRSAKKLKRPLKAVSMNKKPSMRRPMSSNHLVELYHNAAVNYADSEELIQPQPPVVRGVKSHEMRNVLRASSSDMKRNTTKPPRKELMMMLPPAVEDKEDEEEEEEEAVQQEEEEYIRAGGMRILSPIKEHQDAQQHTETAMMAHNCNADPNFPTDFYYNRSYQSPTISSKMKQVARGYFRHFACKSIPFCAAKSTSPSHNIGINIQQVMSIIKGRQTITGISPTLAHNIGLAAERLNNESHSATVSNYGPYASQTTTMCPMQCQPLNFQQLQDMAAEVPTEAILTEDSVDREEDDDDDDDNAGGKREECVSWSIDPSKHNTCTCSSATATGVNFNQVIEKYQTYTPTLSFTPRSYTTTQQQSLLQKPRLTNKRFSHIKSVYAQYNDRGGKKETPQQEIPTENSSANVPFQGNEKILKGVLVNLHEEFAALSDKYDELSRTVEEEKHENVENVQRLEALEKKLTEKEQEIQMVMTLYGEVMNLKQQVTALKEKAGLSQALVETQKQHLAASPHFQQRTMNPMNYQQSLQQHQQLQQQQAYASSLRSRSACKPNAAMHLTKMLRQIQAYQDVCKTGGK